MEKNHDHGVELALLGGGFGALLVTIITAIVAAFQGLFDHRPCSSC